MWIELRRALSVPEAFVVLGVGWHISQSKSLSQPTLRVVGTAVRFGANHRSPTSILSAVIAREDRRLIKWWC